MAQVSFKLRGFDEFAKVLDDRRFRKSLKKHVANATLLNAADLRNEIREKIRKGNFAANRATTILAKGSSRPLVDNGDLLASVTFEPRQPVFSATVGVLRGRRVRDPETGRFKSGGADIRNIAIILHQGARIPVTDRMRRFFWAMFRKGQFEGKVKFFPLKPSTTVIVIPARPFLKKAVEDQPLQKRIQRRWRNAVQRALTEKV